MQYTGVEELRQARRDRWPGVAALAMPQQLFAAGSFLPYFPLRQGRFSFIVQPQL